jgi:hypothetical protein
MGDPTSSYATAGIALRVSEAPKPHHHDKWRHHRWGDKKGVAPKVGALQIPSPTKKEILVSGFKDLD